MSFPPQTNAAGAAHPEGSAVRGDDENHHEVRTGLDVPHDANQRDYYEVLGVERDAMNRRTRSSARTASWP